MQGRAPQSKDISLGRGARAVADVRLDRDRIIRAAQKAFGYVADELDQQFKVEIATPKWDWPRSTKRKNGSTVSSPRDIVDEGILLASQSPPQFDSSAFAAMWDWDVQYSAIVHQGNGSNVPARPWTETAMQAKNWEQILEQKWGELL